MMITGKSFTVPNSTPFFLFESSKRKNHLCQNFLLNIFTRDKLLSVITEKVNYHYALLRVLSPHLTWSWGNLRFSSLELVIIMVLLSNSDYDSLENWSLNDNGYIISIESWRHLDLTQDFEIKNKIKSSRFYWLSLKLFNWIKLYVWFSQFYSLSFIYVSLPLPYRYLTVTVFGQRDPTLLIVHQRYWSFINVTHRYPTVTL